MSNRRSPQRPPAEKQPEAPAAPEEEGLAYEELIEELQQQLGAMSIEMTKQQIVIKKQRKVIADLRAGLVAKNRTETDVPLGEESTAGN